MKYIREKQFMQTKNSYVRLTIAPDRITLKTRSLEEDMELIPHIDRIESEFDAMENVDHTKTYRGELRGKHVKSFHLRDSNRENEIRIIV